MSNQEVGRRLDNMNHGDEDALVDEDEGWKMVGMRVGIAHGEKAVQ